MSCQNSVELLIVTDKAVIVRHAKTGTEIPTPLEFALPRIEMLTRGALRDFHEYETHSSTAIFGGIATRTSRYSKLGELREAATPGLAPNASIS